MLWLLITVAIADTGAYFTGKAIGKTKFSDTSPNKTLEGVFGGIIIATILGTYMGLYIAPFWTALVVTLLTATASVFGDLFESYLKREAGVKDSGDILPGHGGILDRIDGYLFGAPMMVIALRAFL
jgi:phosphatidate cytidylyltransferase